MKTKIDFKWLIPGLMIGLFVNHFQPIKELSKFILMELILLIAFSLIIWVRYNKIKSNQYLKKREMNLNDPPGTNQEQNEN